MVIVVALMFFVVVFLDLEGRKGRVFSVIHSVFAAWLSCSREAGYENLHDVFQLISRILV